MSHTIVLGGGLCGLSAAMMLARDGHRVTVLERDPAPVPADVEAAWERWRRGGVTQFRQAHYLQPLGRAVLERELPDVLEAFKAAGAFRFDPIADAMPQTIADRTPRDGDERFVTYTGRRSTIEWAVSRVAEAEHGVEIRRGVGVTALETQPRDGRVHVTAVRTDAGDRVAGDLIIDAMGRSSALPKLLAAAGGPPVVEEAEDTGFLYYTRFFRGAPPEVRGPINAPVGSFSILTLPGDNGTWSVTLYASAGDRPLKAMRHAEAWTAVVGACPRHAHWLDGEPITGVVPMGGVVDRVRSLNGNGAGPATGVLSLGDAWACTNPSMGRGMTLGLAHAAILRRVVREAGDDPAALVTAYAAATEAELKPWYDSTVLVDRARMAQIVALRDGRTPPAPPPEHIGARIGAALPAAMSLDPDVFRAGIEIAACLSLPRDVFTRPGFGERVFAAAAEATPSAMGPNREELLTLVT
ncbi:FAD-dependent oxidoreductase [Solirubrobacter ginsenosidimutans]|uniref:FAD-dependent oxidoreductase n=1 Tax=Solirubrobacter ginsenosidimutans TaxID=490573 RepID=A0A9X3N770_9ACTN|nr:FAD-dependent oxidoreductase [Solirubrobacter ginsenosidimutans]MDA0166133.1 FAD-dependent oxidoreductase [Solirubrobacter ginsenosidimutans]